MDAWACLTAWWIIAEVGGGPEAGTGTIRWWWGSHWGSTGGSPARTPIWLKRCLSLRRLPVAQAWRMDLWRRWPAEVGYLLGDDDDDDDDEEEEEEGVEEW